MASLTYLDNLQDDHDDYISEYLEIFIRLIKQKAINFDITLPTLAECTLIHLQHIVECIFNGQIEAMIYQMAHKEILKNEDLHNNSRLLLKKLSPFQVMNFPQVILYKTLPCPEGDNCKRKPREIAPSNQYKDEELECPFFHHEKDRRRLPISRKVEDEFIYKANYDKSKCDPFPDKFSKNYFESMFHPIYYRLFQCKRIYCQNSFFCPFFHTKGEKTTWDETFLTNIRKSREVYTKEKKEKISSPRSQNDFMNRYEIFAIDKKPPVHAQSQILMDRISTRSSTNSSPSSHNELSPEQEIRYQDDLSIFQATNMYYGPSGTHAESYGSSNTLSHNSMNTMDSFNNIGSFNNISSFNELNNMNMGSNAFNKGNKGIQNSQSLPMSINDNVNRPNTFSLFGDYSNIFMDTNDKENEKKENMDSQPEPLTQFFNWQMIRNINNLKLHH